MTRRARQMAALACAAALFAAACAEPTAPGRLIVLVSVDTLRADRLGAYGSELGLTPEIDALAAESVVFERAYAPASFTLPSVSALLTGLNPEQTGIITNEYTLDERVPTLATSLREAGFATGAVVANWVLRRASGLERGFDVYDDAFPASESARGVPEALATTTTDDALAALDLLAERAGPGAARFLWVHYQDPHGPYTPPAKWVEPLVERELARPDGRRELALGDGHSGLGSLPAYQQLGDERRVGVYRASYDGEVRYLDHELGRLLAGLRARRVFDAATIVFCSDHGEGMGEDDYWFAHGEYLSDPLVRVPLFFKLPRAGAAPTDEVDRDAAARARTPRRADIAGLVDVLPTIAGLTGVEAPPGLAGRDLFAPGPLPERALVLASLGASTLPRYGLVSGEHKLVATLAPNGTVDALRISAPGADDGGGDVDLTGELPELAAALYEKLGTVRKTLAASRYASRPLEPSAADVENLRKLGYVE